MREVGFFPAEGQGWGVQEGARVGEKEGRQEGDVRGPFLQMLISIFRQCHEKLS